MCTVLYVSTGDGSDLLQEAVHTVFCHGVPSQGYVVSVCVRVSNIV